MWFVLEGIQQCGIWKELMGISITSLHEHFSKDHFVLMYEITAKMAADIHTKGFTNPLAWKKACMLINLLEPEDLGSEAIGRPSAAHYGC